MARSTAVGAASHNRLRSQALATGATLVARDIAAYTKQGKSQGAIAAPQTPTVGRPQPCGGLGRRRRSHAARATPGERARWLLQTECGHDSRRPRQGCSPGISSTGDAGHPALLPFPGVHLGVRVASPPSRGLRGIRESGFRQRRPNRRRVALSACSREVGVATEMLLTKAEQVSDGGACAAGLRLEQQSVDRLAGGCSYGRAGARSTPVSAGQIRPTRQRGGGRRWLLLP
jgi:hypothetical protein